MELCNGLALGDKEAIAPPLTMLTLKFYQH